MLTLVITSLLIINTDYSYAASKKVYTTSVWTTLYKKQRASSGSIRVWYNTPLTRVRVKKTGAGKWSKVKYRGKTYYLWEGKNESKVTTRKISDNYTSSSYTDYQNEVLRFAMKLYKLETKYDYSHNAELGKKDSDGKYPFDCSGFASYVLTSVLQKDCPAYNISRGDTQLYETENILNEGLAGEFNAVTVCRGKPDFSKLQPGDLLFFKQDDYSSEKIDHVAIYLGKKRLIESTKMYQRYPGDSVKYKGEKKSRGGLCIAPLNYGIYYSNFVAAKRFIPAKGFKTVDLSASVREYTGIYAGTKCDGSKGNEKLVKVSPGNTVKILYTLYRGDGTKLAYVRYPEAEDASAGTSDNNTEDKTEGYMRADKLELS